MNKKLKYLLLFIATAGAVQAQDIHLTQFYAAPLYLNPAFAGMDRCSKYTIAIRNQWPSIHKAYSTYLFTADNYSLKYHSGYGICVASDMAGSGGLRTTLFNINYAYELLITRKTAFRFGMQGGMQQKSISYADLLFGDQITRGGPGVNTVEPIPESKTFFDVGAGALLFNRDFWAGISMSHLNEPDESLIGEGSPLPIKTSVHGGVKIAITSPDKKNESQYLIPAVNYQHQNKFSQISWGLYYVKPPFNAGIWYRGIPFSKDEQTGYSNNDALSFLIGFSQSDFSIGYSYDLTFSRLTPASGGAHEIVLSYKFCRKKNFKKNLFTPCPKF